MDIKGLRKEYANPVLSRDMLVLTLFHQFERWFDEACRESCPNPTPWPWPRGQHGWPAARCCSNCLTKTVSSSTNYSSCKAQQIQENHHVALLFPWI